MAHFFVARDDDELFKKNCINVYNNISKNDIQKNVNRYDDNFFLFLISIFVIHFPVALKLCKMKFVTGDNHNEMTEKKEPAK